MNNYNLNVIEDIFSRLFVLAVQSKMNLNSFTNKLERSSFIEDIEKMDLEDISNKTVSEIYKSVTGEEVIDNSYGVYNDAFWCGSSYFKLHFKLNKPFSYLFLKLPLEQLVDVYPILHEMDISSLVSFFLDVEKKKTILRILCENKRCSLGELSKNTSISVHTLIKYNNSDDNLYKASFQNIIFIATYFDVPIRLFMRESFSSTYLNT